MIDKQKCRACHLRRYAEKAQPPHFTSLPLSDDGNQSRERSGPVEYHGISDHRMVSGEECPWVCSEQAPLQTAVCSILSAPRSQTFKLFWVHRWPQASDQNAWRDRPGCHEDLQLCQTQRRRRWRVCGHDRDQGKRNDARRGSHSLQGTLVESPRLRNKHCHGHDGSRRTLTVQ